MAFTQTSGDLLADKRFAYAETLAAEGDMSAAADLYEQATVLVPHWAAAHLAWGLALEQLGQRSRAEEVLVEAEQLDVDGVLGAGLHRARVAGSAVEALPAAYVAALFDQYAPRFDRHLTAQLAYRGPEIILRTITQLGQGELDLPVLDLGCGTGLMARALGSRVRTIDGIDLSAAMVARARETGLYRDLIVGECTAIMAALAARSYALVLAADVLVYIGDLKPLLKQARRVLVPGGLFVATVQTGQPGEGAWLGHDLRFRHDPDIVRGALDEAGLDLSTLDPCVTRREGGSDVPGLVFAARAP